MRVLIPALAGMGLALLASGLPPLNPTRLPARVEPYLNGLGGRPSALVPAAGGMGRARRRLQEIALRVAPLDRISIRDRLLKAGQNASPESFRLDQVLWATGAACGVVAIGSLLGAFAVGPGTGTLFLLVPLASVGGWVARDRRLSRDLARRREVVRQELPLALDLLTLSIMAGEAVPQAFDRVARMLGGEVGQEFAHVVGSVRAGSPIIDALQDLPRRLPEPSAVRFVDGLCTGIERGAPLAETLRAQAEDLREAHRRELLESGGRREILMLLPVVFLILPTVVAFTLLPGLVSLDLLVP